MSYCVSMGNNTPILNGMSNGLQEFLQTYRRESGLTQKELAEKAGVKQPTVSDIERGQVKFPSADIRRRLAKALGVSHVDLLIAAGELAADEVAAGGVVEVDESDPRELLAQRVRRMRLNDDDLILLNRMLDTWDERNRRAR